MLPIVQEGKQQFQSWTHSFLGSGVLEGSGEEELVAFAVGVVVARVVALVLEATVSFAVEAVVVATVVVLALAVSIRVVLLTWEL